MKTSQPQRPSGPFPEPHMPEELDSDARLGGMNVASATDATGLIPAARMQSGELEAYAEFYPFADEDVTD